jgi:hypothetical protein
VTTQAQTRTKAQRKRAGAANFHRKQSAMMTSADFAAAWDGLLRAFLFEAEANEWCRSRRSFARDEIAMHHFSCRMVG